jgi:hypothetical protein
MKRLYVACEGQTEETFVNEMLRPHFLDLGVYVDALVIPNKAGSSARIHKGGWINYVKTRKFLQITMEEKHNADTWFTTMLDLYALPHDFPGADATAGLSGRARVEALEQAFADDILTDQYWRFTPYLQLYEYETLLLSEPDALLGFYPDRQAEVAALKADIAGLQPEEINDSPNTAPSKRILRFIPDYTKVIGGTLVADAIGLQNLRARCPHFHGWLETLENKLNV